MSQRRSMYNTVDICCPHCDHFNEINDFEVSVTVENTDEARKVNECLSIYKCTNCDINFTINPEMNIEVNKA